MTQGTLNRSKRTDYDTNDMKREREDLKVLKKRQDLNSSPSLPWPLIANAKLNCNNAFPTLSFHNQVEIQGKEVVPNVPVGSE
jgi:hypothetical protein